ncbi:Telomerase activating protein Est1 [Phytophthora cactorum]|nr:Telomerase activating protein Est1 [Phytophthora cactorum]
MDAATRLADAHPAFAAYKEVEQALWKPCFYRRIEDFRRRIRKYAAAAQADRNVREHFARVSSEFQLFLTEAAAFYAHLRDVFASWLQTAPKEDGDAIARCRQSLHRCYVFLGDLARYRELHSQKAKKNFAAAEALYHRALVVLPENGNPHNQLAVLATYVEAETVAVYRYCRSLLTSQPFTTAEENLALLFERSRQRPLAAPITFTSSSPPSKEKSAFLKSYLHRLTRMHGILFALSSPTGSSGTRSSSEIATPVYPRDMEAVLFKDMRTLLHAGVVGDALLLKIVVTNIFCIIRASDSRSPSAPVEDALRLSIRTITSVLEFLLDNLDIKPKAAANGPVTVFCDYLELHPDMLEQLEQLLVHRQKKLYSDVATSDHGTGADQFASVFLETLAKLVNHARVRELYAPLVAGAGQRNADEQHLLKESLELRGFAPLEQDGTTSTWQDEWALQTSATGANSATQETPLTDAEAATFTTSPVVGKENTQQDNGTSDVFASLNLGFLVGTGVDEDDDFDDEVIVFQPSPALRGMSENQPTKQYGGYMANAPMETLSGEGAFSLRAPSPISPAEEQGHISVNNQSSGAFGAGNGFNTFNDAGSFSSQSLLSGWGNSTISNNNGGMLGNNLGLGLGMPFSSSGQDTGGNRVGESRPFAPMADLAAIERESALYQQRSSSLSAFLGSSTPLTQTETQDPSPPRMPTRPPPGFAAASTGAQQQQPNRSSTRRTRHISVATPIERTQEGGEEAARVNSLNDHGTSRSCRSDIVEVSDPKRLLSIINWHLKQKNDAAKNKPASSKTSAVASASRSRVIRTNVSLEQLVALSRGAAAELPAQTQVTAVEMSATPIDSTTQLLDDVQKIDDFDRINSSKKAHAPSRPPPAATGRGHRNLYGSQPTRPALRIDEEEIRGRLTSRDLRTLLRLHYEKPKSWTHEVLADKYGLDVDTMRSILSSVGPPNLGNGWKRDNAGLGAARGGLSDEEEVASMHHFIENALDLLIKSYQYLIQQLTLVPPPVATRRKIFRALPRCISTMAREPKAYRALLDVLFKFDLSMDYTRFIVHLVSSNTVYVVPTMHMLVRNMRRPQEKELPPDLRALAQASRRKRKRSRKPQKTGGIAIGGSFGANAVATPTPVAEPVQEAKGPGLDERIQARFEAAHQTLERVLTLVPTAANVLFPILEHFPHKRMDAPTQVAYLRNVLRVTGYVGGLRERVLGLVLDQLIKLDESEEDMFTMDDFLDDDMLPPDDASRQVDEMADKLDQMMLVMFEHIEQSAATDNSNGDKNVDYLLKVFEHSILNTHRSKYPQFLLFYVCRMDPQFQDVFISQLLATSLDPQTPPTTRQSCGAYLASFLARAKYISVAYLQKALYHLLKWLHDQMDVYDAAHQDEQEKAEAREGETTAERDERLLEESENMETTGERGFQESIFISSLQTVCYMVCFRGLEIATSDDGAGYEFLRSLGWERLLVTSGGYCPLAYCQQTAFDLVSEECLERVDQAIGTVSASTSKSAKSMERSKKPTAGSASASTLLGQRQPLETFFPFDPYLLRRSFRYIGPLYLYWKHADPTSSENCELLESVKATIRQMQENADEDEEEDDGSEEEEDLIDEDVSMAGSAPNPSNASYRADSYMGSLSRSCNMSVSSSYDGSHTVRRPLPSRFMFDPSPALSASSPPSRLPPLGAADAFTLGGFDDEDEDEGF